MKNNLTFTLLTLLLLNFTTTQAQKIYELHEVKQIPTIANDNMDIIASSIQKMFTDAIKDPQKNSTTAAANEVVYSFYDSDEDRKLHQMNPSNGKQYTVSDSSRLRLNQINSYRKEMSETSLLFNLTFDENGKLIVPEKINVISYRTEDVKKNRSTYVEQVGLLAFELVVSDSIKKQLAQVKLKTLAQIDVNSLTGGLKPVAILCPFNFKCGSYQSDKTKGHAIKKGDNIDISIEGYFKDSDEKDKIINILKEKSEILTYKKGEFDFIIAKEVSYRSVGFNIVADNIIANRISKTSTGGSSKKVDKVISFSGEGKKIKN